MDAPSNRSDTLADQAQARTTVPAAKPLLAAFIHVASELAFILNSARLLPAPIRDEDKSVGGPFAEPVR